jgi:class 3 adenylate cyclase
MNQTTLQQKLSAIASFPHVNADTVNRCGAALATNADDRLDYFGQTVNIAARVQALAQAGEIWLTEPVFQTDGVKNAFIDSGYHNQKHPVSLKGVGQPTLVYQ